MARLVWSLSWKRFAAGFRKSMREMRAQAEVEFHAQEKPQTIPYIEIMLPITGIVTPTQWSRRAARSQAAGSVAG